MSNKIKKRIRRNDRSLNIEPLESRVLLDGVGVVNAGVFVFVDNDGNDTNNVTGSITGGALRLSDANNDIIAGPGVTQINASTIEVPLANFTTFVAQLKGGNDRLILPSGLTTLAIIEGDSGSDTITGGGGNDIILGGSGNDDIQGAGGNDVIFGGLGSDTISGGAGMDVAVGWEGNLADIPGSLMTVGTDTGNDNISGNGDGDVVQGGLGADTVDGGSGNDTVTGDEGADILIGGFGNDTVLGGGGNDTINGGDNDDLIDAGPGNDTVVGGSGNDTINGSDDPDLIDGGSGNDTIAGGGGNDTILGGTGEDQIFGEAGADLIEAGNDNDTVDGGTENDTIFGGLGNDTLSGGAGLDAVVGWEGNLADVLGSLGTVGTDTGDDTINGNGEADTLRGGLGNDILVGGEGNDLITGDSDNDILIGGIGNDTLIGNGGNDTINGGIDPDHIEGNLGNDTIAGGSGNDTITGDAGEDLIFGEAGADLIEAGNDNDTVDGGTENDTIFGGLGNDTLSGGAGSDAVVGWEGNLADVLGSLGTVGTDTGDDTINGNEGADLLRGGLGNDIITGGADNDTITGDAGEDSIGGDGGADVISAGTENDIVDGGSENDTIFGGAGNDTILGSAGDDQILGEAGEDLIDAGADNDLVDGGTENDTIFGGLGNDTITGAAGEDSIVGWEGNLADITNSLLIVGADTGDDDISGNEDADFLRGGLGNDFIDGGDGADNITGDGDSDILEGNLGDDTISGGAGNDLIGGFSGNDVLLPGTGNDVVYGDSTYDRAGVRTSAAPVDHGDDTIFWLDGDDTDFIFGEGGTDFAVVALLAGAIPAGGLFIDMGDNVFPNRDIVDVVTEGQRTPNFTYTDGAPAGLVISGLGAGSILTSQSETIIYRGDVSNDDIATVTGTIHDDNLTVAPVSSSKALVFTGGDPWDGPFTEGDFFDQFPGVAGGNNGPDLDINGLAPAAQDPLTIDGGGTDGVGDRLYVYSTSEDDLVDVASQGANVDFGFGDGVIVPGSDNGANPLPNAYDTIIVTDQKVSIINNAVELVPVGIVPTSFAQTDMDRKALIVNAGFEDLPAGNGIADDIFAALSFNFAIDINGGDPDPDLSLVDDIPPEGDRLQVETPAEINIFSDKETPPNVNFNSGGSKNMGFSSIETIVLTPSNGTREVNIFGDNDDPAVDQNDNYIVRGRNIDSNLAPIAGAAPQFQPDPNGTNEFTLELNGSVPISFRNVQYLNAFGDDSELTPSVGPDDIDTLDVSPYADNTTLGWDIDVFFNEGNPAQADGVQADLLIYRTSIFGKSVSEDIVIQPAGPEAGKLTVTNAANDSLIVDITYENNLDIIVSDDDGFASDTDTLTIRGTDSATPSTSGKDVIDANFEAAGDLANPLIVVSDQEPVDPLSPILYRVRDIVGITTVNIEALGGNDQINVTPSEDFAVYVDGGAPNGAIPGIGDTLNIVSMEPFVYQKGADPSSGTFFVGTNDPVSFENIEALQVAGLEYRPPGPRVKNVTISGEPDYNLFQPNPNDGPTPLFNMLDISFLASQFGLSGLDAVDQILATTPGNYSLVGDHVGPIFVQSVQVISIDNSADPMLTVKLTFSQFLPDDRYTLTIQDDITDPLGNRLDGDSHGLAGGGNPTVLFPSGDGNPGTDFVARFTVDSRPEVGVYSAPEIFIDANGNTMHDALGGGDAANSDLFFLLQHEDDQGNLLPGGFNVHDTLFTGNFATGNLVVGGEPDVVFVIDVSGSTGNAFAGSPVGDLNNDGLFNRILDAEIAGFIALNQDLIDRGLGDIADIIIVPFASGAQILDMDPVAAGVQTSTTPNADTNTNGILDVVEVLSSLLDGGGTNFEAPLQSSITAFDLLGTTVGNGNVIFLSDGFGSGNFLDEVNEIKVNRGQNLRAFGVGAGSSLAQLLQMDPEAIQFTTTDELVQALGGGGQAGGGTATGFDTLAAYGFFDGANRWLIDINGDGVITPTEGDIFNVQPTLPGFDVRNALPIAGDFNGNPDDGDEIGLYGGGKWYLDSNANDVIDVNDTLITSIVTGMPVVGDFDGDNLDDLAGWSNKSFLIDLANDGLGVGPVSTIHFDVPGISQLPVVADMDADGIDDLGLYNYAVEEWSFLQSNNHGGPIVPGSVAALNHTFSPQNVGGDDLFFTYGIGRFALPIVGNFNSQPLIEEQVVIDEQAAAVPATVSLDSLAGLQTLSATGGSSSGTVAANTAAEDDEQPLAAATTFDLAMTSSEVPTYLSSQEEDESAFDELFAEIGEKAVTDDFLFELKLHGLG